MDGVVLARWLWNGLQVLRVIGHDDTGDGSFRFGDTNRTVDQVSRLDGGREHMDVLTRHILKEGDQVNLLLIIPAEGSTGRLPDNSNDWLMVHLRIIQAIQQVNCARP